MHTLEEFGKRVEAALAVADQPSHSAADAGPYMKDIERRHSLFQQTATRLMGTVIRPRLERFISYFENARFAKSTDPLRCRCQFGYSTRCPANILLEIGLSHDERIQDIIISCEVQIIPAFIKYNRFDHVEGAVEAISDDDVAAWIEHKLLDFVHVYHRLEHADRDQSEVLVTDPVCGMRMNRSEVTDRMDYKGHPYFFCTSRCKEQFAAEPERYVTVAMA